jgi:small conductance mechanosensitive channel
VLLSNVSLAAWVGPISLSFDKLWTKLQGWFDAGVSMLPNFLLAVAVVVAAAFAGRYIARWVAKAIERFTDNEGLASLICSVARVAVIAIGLFGALSLLHLDKTVTSLLAGLGVVGLALGFAFKDIAANFMSGALMAMHGPFEVGDIVEVDGRRGTVEQIHLRQTVLRTFDGLNVVIPNKEVFQNTLTNYTRTNERRVDVAVGVAYDSPLREVRDIAMQAVEDLEGRDPKRELELFYEGFGASSIDFVLRIWLREAGEIPYLRARSEAIMRVKEAFDEHDITIPFPIRTLDFGADAVGGERLEQLALAEDRRAS